MIVKIIIRKKKLIKNKTRYPILIHEDVLNFMSAYFGLDPCNNVNQIIYLTAVLEIVFQEIQAHVYQQLHHLQLQQQQVFFQLQQQQVLLQLQRQAHSLK